MSEDGDSALGWLKDGDDGDDDPDSDEVFRLDPEGQGKEKHFLIGVKNAEGHEQAEDATGSAHGFGAGVHAEEMGIGDGNGYQGSAYDAECIALDESTRTPIAFEVGSDKPEREHVKEDVAEAGVQQRIGDQLPHLAMHHVHGNQG